MRHTHRHGFGRRFARSEHDHEPGSDQAHDHGHHRHRRGFGGRHRPFDHGELRLLALSMMATEPRHGYELMKGIEERLGGTYSPSPGVIYPTLSWLEDMGFVALDTAEGGRKRYRITPEGAAFLEANRPALEALEARLGSGGEGRPGIPAPMLRAMENLKLALRLRLRRGPVEPEAAEAIAASLDAAAIAVGAQLMDTLSSRAEWHGALARRYLIQLCKHFQHRIPVTLDDGEAASASGTIVFEAGTCALRAEGETLTLLAAAEDAANLARVQDVVARHFERFAFREEVALAWQPA